MENVVENEVVQTRPMATIERIIDIQPIPDADAIEVATVKGWKVVVKKDEFKVDDLVTYCEIDSFIPNSLAAFLSKGSEPREYNGVKGERLRTVRLRKQVSQGLILPLHPTCDMITSQLVEGLDVTTDLSIQKWEAPIATHLAGFTKGNFPSWGRKTDQERVENIIRDVFTDNVDSLFEITLK